MTRNPKPWLPRRARARWLEGAPPFVCDVFDDKGLGDRYTVFFTGRDFITGPEPRACYLGMSEAPTHPQGVSMWGELTPRQFADYRRAFSRHRIRWLDLPENVRRHVIERARS